MIIVDVRSPLSPATIEPMPGKKMLIRSSRSPQLFVSIFGTSWFLHTRHI